MKNSFAPRRAFTLIEILVVIAIIGILSAVLFPVLAKARENGRAKVCVSNMKQLGLAFQQYTADSGGKYPLAAPYQKWAFGAHWVTGGTVDAAGVKTAKNFTDTEMGLAAPTTFETVDGHQAFPQNPTSALAAYTKSADIYICPSAVDKDKKKLSYSMNCALSGLGSNGKMRAPADIVLLVDEGKTINDGYFWASSSASSTDQVFDGHNGGGNLLYADAHVKFIINTSIPADVKTRQTGSPRFYDRGFGPKGASIQPPTSSDATTKDSCSNDIP